jgi:SagB-type dehydrogenase family enzyme
VIAFEYHERTKHHFNRFAASLGYLDWASQPDPFRRFEGARLVELPRRAVASEVPYDALFTGGVAAREMTLDTIGEFLRCSLGLSAWKQYQASRWALRVNPSSGNLHPTEGYIVWDSRVWHYASREHAIEERCTFDGGVAALLANRGAFLAGLTSIHWREAWKYGERAFRYCQHDAGHAIGALRFAAALLGWRMTLLPWADRDIATALGVDRDEDFAAAEREDPDCIAVVSRGEESREQGDQGGLGAKSLTDLPDLPVLLPGFDPEPFVAAVRGGRWSGAANRLSSQHVDWPIIERVADATRFNSGMVPGRANQSESQPGELIPRRKGARDIILTRRSALAFDGHSSLPRDLFLGMLRRTVPEEPPWDVMPWSPHVHLALFVHRVDGLQPGLYFYFRDDTTRAEMRASCRQEFLWESIDSHLDLLVPIDCRRIANRVSCDQDIAEDGFFGLSMIARFEQPIVRLGEWFYRRLFWECGLVGQVLYLEAEAVGARATGIGCYYDDPVHELLGLSGPAWQSLYHFSMGMPVEDRRLTSEPGYAWELR